MFKTIRTGNGEFECHYNGKDSGIRIFNGSHGSNNPTNTYGIVWANGKIAKIGPLASCKRLVENFLKK